MSALCVGVWFTAEEAAALRAAAAEVGFDLSTYIHMRAVLGGAELERLNHPAVIATIPEGTP